MLTTMTNRSVRWLDYLTAGLLAAGLCCPAGCGRAPENLPATCEVTGTVLAADGKPMSGGLIEFRSRTQNTLPATGRIGADGTFALTTMVDQKKLPGAVAGSHQVTVMPPLPQSQGIQPVVQPITLPGTLEVKSGGKNQFTVKLPPTR
jgi:hypothetical protein